LSVKESEASTRNRTPTRRYADTFLRSGLSRNENDNDDEDEHDNPDECQLALKRAKLQPETTRRHADTPTRRYDSPAVRQTLDGMV
jgi:hypothetical protein